MKKLLQHIVFTIVLCSLIFLLSSCSRGIDTSEAKAHINQFFSAIVDENYKKAETLLHPELSIELETFFVNAEKENCVDFQDGIKIEKYTGFSSALYDSIVDGSMYELTMKTTVGEKTVEFTVKIVNNETGYGIYNFDLST